MNFKQFLSVILSLFIFLSFSSCKTTKSNTYMKFIGQSFIQEGIKIGDVAQNNFTLSKIMSRIYQYHQKGYIRFLS